MAAKFRNTAPEFRVMVRDTIVQTDVQKYIKSITFEHSVALADMVTLIIDNPGNAWTDHRLWSPGNEIDIWIGWGQENVNYQGRAIIGKHLPHWGRDGTSTLEVRAYDASKKMMNEGAEAETFPGLTDSQIVTRIAEKYGFSSDIEITRRVNDRFKKEGMTDYELVRGLANINNMEFYVDYDRDDLGVWVLHWHSALSQPQDRVYTFEYGSTLTEFSLEDALDDAPVEVRVLAYNTVSGEFIEQGIQELAIGEDPRFNAGNFNNAAEAPLQILSHTRLKLALGEDKSIEIVTGRHLKTDAEAIAFAEAWFQKKKDSFIIANGTAIGVETLRPRQAHVIDGIGTRYGGNYYMTTVRQMIDDAGFRTEFTANKVMS